MPVSLESALFQRLNGLAGLISFQSTVKSGKVKVPVYPGVMPDTDETGLRTDLPAIVFQRYSTRALSSFGVDHQLYAFGVQLDIYAKSYADVRGISDVVQDSLQRYQGGSFSDVFLNDVFDDYEEEDRTYRVVHDYTIWASNLSPVLDTVLNDLDVYVKFDQMLDLTGSFSDPEGDAVSYDVVSRNTARVQVSIFWQYGYHQGCRGRICSANHRVRNGYAGRIWVRRLHGEHQGSALQLCMAQPGHISAGRRRNQAQNLCL